jgi:hypothetical protein
MTDVRLEPVRGAARRGEQLTFRLLVAVTYPLFLAAAVVARIAAIGSDQPDEDPSVFSRALKMSEATFAFAFMG